MAKTRSKASKPNKANRRQQITTAQDAHDSTNSPGGSQQKAQNSTVSANRKCAATRKRRTTKKQTCIDLLRRQRGASLDELQQATGWQPHSVQGFLSGTVRKTPGLILSSEKPDGGHRRYRIVDQPQTVRS